MTEDEPVNGEWVELIHKCPTPSAQEVEDKSAEIGSVWECGHCHDHWKLLHIRPEPGLRLYVDRYPKWQRLSINGEPITSTGPTSTPRMDTR